MWLSETDQILQSTIASSTSMEIRSALPFEDTLSQHPVTRIKEYRLPSSSNIMAPANIAKNSNLSLQDLRPAVEPHKGQSYPKQHNGKTIASTSVLEAQYDTSRSIKDSMAFNFRENNISWSWSEFDVLPSQPFEDWEVDYTSVYSSFKYV